MKILLEKLQKLERMEEIANHAEADYEREPENAEYEKTFDLAYQNEFKAYIDNEDAQIVDVRGAIEYEEGHVKGADHVFVGTLQDNLDKIDKDKQVIIHCQAGDRSTIAYSLLKRNGFDKVKNYSGGMKEFLKYCLTNFA